MRVGEPGGVQGSFRQLQGHQKRYSFAAERAGGCEQLRCAPEGLVPGARDQEVELRAPRNLRAREVHVCDCCKLKSHLQGCPVVGGRVLQGWRCGRCGQGRARGPILARLPDGGVVCCDLHGLVTGQVP
jgi:hypothetical protein